MSVENKENKDKAENIEYCDFYGKWTGLSYMELFLD